MRIDRCCGFQRWTLASSLLLGFGALVCPPQLIYAQAKSGAEWATGSYNPQRDGWQRDETKLTPQSVRQMNLLWKTKLDNKPMGMQSFREPLIINGVTTPSGTASVAILAGSSNDVFVLNADTGATLWHKKLDWASSTPPEPGEGRGFICTNALTATPVVSEPQDGERMLYVLTSDGYLHTMKISDGTETGAPIQVLSAPYGKPYGLNLVNNVIYTITGQGCGGVPNALYAIDLKTRKVTSSEPPQAGLWGVAGPAIASNGTIYFESGDGAYDAAKKQLSTSVEAFTYSDGTLNLKDYFTPTNYIWLTKRDLDMNATPVIFPYKGRDFLVASGKEGRFFLLDSKSLGGANHQTPVFRSDLISNTDANFQTEGTWGSHAAWKAKDGTQWVLAPTGSPTNVKFPVTNGPQPNGGIIAFKVAEKDGEPYLAPAWMSPDMLTAEPPIVANGVVFALAGGEFTGQANDEEGGLYSSADRIAKSKPAVLYALDAETGKVLYSSGNQIASFLHQAGPAVAGGRVIFGTFDGTVYCFGVK
jgi:outer membrane protein assembly factor BamB